MTFDEKQKHINDRRDRLNALSDLYGGEWSVSRLRRYFVRSMRVVLPLFGVVLLAGLFVLPKLDSDKQILSFEDIEFEKTIGRIEMMLPHYRAYDEEQRPYDVKAIKAVRNVDTPDQITLESPVAEWEMDVGDLMQIEAAAGDYDQTQGTLNLNGNVMIEDADGYILNTNHMDVDLKNGTATSKTPVSGHGPKGEIESQGLIIQDKGNKVILEGKSKIILQ